MYVYVLIGVVLAPYKPKLYAQTNIVELHLFGRLLSGSPIIRIGLAIRVNFFKNSKKLTCLEITGYLIKYSTVLWLIELHIRRGGKV